MDELLESFGSNITILDLGSGSGSFGGTHGSFVVRLDILPPQEPTVRFVQADASTLPFPDGSFDLVVSNNSLEHFSYLDGALHEVRRVVKKNGAVYVAIPDSSTISDRLYRWLAKGGGHVNAFSSLKEVVALLESSTGLKHVSTRTLYTSLCCLNRLNRPSVWRPKRLLLLGGGTQASLMIATYALRLADRTFKTRYSVYGWAIYLGEPLARLASAGRTNVCIRCGDGHPSHWLTQKNLVKKLFLLLRSYRCPSCGTLNLFTDD